MPTVKRSQFLWNPSQRTKLQLKFLLLSTLQYWEYWQNGQSLCRIFLLTVKSMFSRSCLPSKTFTTSLSVLGPREQTHARQKTQGIIQTSEEEVQSADLKQLCFHRGFSQQWRRCWFEYPSLLWDPRAIFQDKLDADHDDSQLHFGPYPPPPQGG